MWTQKELNTTSYLWAPMDSIASLLEFTLVAKDRLPEVTMPTLILQSTKDTTASPESAQNIYNSISTPSEEKEIIWFEKTEDEMFRDLEREAVVDTILKYVKKRVGKLNQQYLPSKRCKP